MIKVIKVHDKRTKALAAQAVQHGVLLQCPKSRLKKLLAKVVKQELSSLVTKDTWN
jgi:uncharacterized protein YjbI with pentapeptide repeats